MLEVETNTFSEKTHHKLCFLPKINWDLKIDKISVSVVCLYLCVPIFIRHLELLTNSPLFPCFFFFNEANRSLVSQE